MAITFYCGSGSPFSWKVWLALEHKQLAYSFKLMSLQSGDLKKPEYLALNPRGKVPALVDDDLVICESAVVLEYLEDRYPDHPLLPQDAHERVTARRIAAEANNYLYPAERRLFVQTLFQSNGAGDAAEIALALPDLKRELAYFEDALDDEFFAGRLSVADFTIYPMLALVRRLQDKQPQHDVGSYIGPKLAGFMRRIERLPYFSRTTPPHWKG